jgi:FAD/FMN-containing dehydrogenase
MGWNDATTATASTSMSRSSRTSRVREASGDANYQRLAEGKAKYDPENVFHDNKNIQPGTPTPDRTAHNAG